MNNKGWGLNEMLICCGLLGIAFLVVIVLIEQNFKNLVNAEDQGFNQTYTYSQIEKSLIVASTNYLEDQRLEIEDGSTLKITMSTLLEKGYIQNLYDKNNNLCTGYVVYSKDRHDYSYKPYVKCGSDYKTDGYMN